MYTMICWLCPLPRKKKSAVYANLILPLEYLESIFLINLSESIKLANLYIR